MKFTIDTKDMTGFVVGINTANQVEGILTRKHRFKEDLHGTETFYEIIRAIGPDISGSGGNALDAIEWALRLTELFEERNGITPKFGDRQIHLTVGGESPEPLAHFVPDEPADVQDMLHALGRRVAKDMAGDMRGRIAAVFILEDRPAEAAPVEDSPMETGVDPHMLKINLENEQIRANIALVKARIRCEEAAAAEIEARTRSAVR